MPNPSHEIFSAEDRKKFRFWNTAPTDGRARAGKAGISYFPKGRQLFPTSPMPIPEHAGKTMKQVPLDYLRWVNEQPWSAQWADWAPVADYIARFPIGDWIEHSGPMIFVDPLRPCVPSKKWRWSESAHLTTLPEAEPLLHAFAVGALGLNRAWFQARDYLAHYDLTPAKHAQAIAAGAFLLDTREAERAHIQTHRNHSRPCHKKCYGNQEEANQVIKEAASRGRNSVHLRAYTCPQCGFLHLTRSHS